MKSLVPVILIALVLVVIWYVTQRDSKPVDIKLPDAAKLPFPCIIDGPFNCPPMAAAIAARNTALIRLGHGVESGQDDNDNSSRNNTILGGGPPYGGIHLVGYVHFEIDSTGQQIPDKSWISIFSGERHPVTGGVELNGQIGMGSVAGVAIKGKVENGQITLGRVSESGMDVEVGGELWNKLDEVTKANLTGNTYTDPDGKVRIEYVHGDIAATVTPT